MNIDDEDLELRDTAHGEEDDAHEEGLEEGREDDDAHETDGQEDEGDAEEVGAAPRQGRAQSRIARLSEEARTEREERQKLRRELDELKADRQQRSQREDPELERQRLELMSPEERMEYRFNKARDEDRRERKMLEVRLWDTDDKSSFNSLVASDARAKKYAGEVEKLHREQLQKGNPLPRETILKYMLGEKLLANGQKALDKQKKTGQANLDRQRTRPVNGRGDRPAGGRGGQSVEDRLADVTF